MLEDKSTPLLKQMVSLNEKSSLGDIKEYKELASEQTKSMQVLHKPHDTVELQKHLTNKTSEGNTGRLPGFSERQLHSVKASSAHGTGSVSLCAQDLILLTDFIGYPELISLLSQG